MVKGEAAIAVRGSGWSYGAGDLCLVAAGLETRTLLGRFSSILLPLAGQAFRTPPLKECARSSVVGLSAGWGSERYRFDDELRLLGCGISPRQSFQQGTNVDQKAMKVLLERAAQLFTDFEGEAEQTMQWAVEFTGTCDGLPLLGALPGEPRIQVATGFGASAWSRGWEAGLSVAAAIRGQAENLLLGRCSPGRFLRVR